MTEKKRGRPSTKHLPNFRTRSWFNAVSQASGLSASQLDLKYFNCNPRPCLWEKYRDGKVTPSATHNSFKNKSIIDRVESDYPGTKKWITLPLWNLLDKNAWPTAELQEALLGTNLEISQLLIENSGVDTKWFLRGDISTNSNTYIEKLKTIGNAEALTAIYVIYIFAENGQNHTLGYAAILAFSQLLDNLKDGEPIYDLKDEIRSIISKQNSFIEMYFSPNTLLL